MHLLSDKAWKNVWEEIKLKWEEMVGLGSCSLNVEYSLQEEYGQNFFFQDNKQIDKWNNI